MIVDCPSCHARYKFDENKLGERPKVRTKCSKCGATIEIDNPLMGNYTLPPGPPPGETTKKTQTISNGELDLAPAPADVTGRDLGKMVGLKLPSDKRYSLAVIQGASTGQMYQITKARTVLGRQGVDVNLDDPEASRQHAAVEVLGEHAILRDLGSTNGTFVDVERIEQKVLQNQMEFRIGSHVLMFIVTAVE